MNKKNTIRLTESGMKRVIYESVKKILKETSGLDTDNHTVLEGINGYYTNYKGKDGNLYDDFAEAFLKDISKIYQSPFHAAQVVFQIVTNAASICGCNYQQLMKQIQRDYENMEFHE